MSGLADCSKSATSVAIRCVGCQRVLHQTYIYVKEPSSVPEEFDRRLAGPFCDDCANRRRAK